MKGHKDKDGKFHPHTQYNGVRKPRDQSTKTEGIRLQRDSKKDFFQEDEDWMCRNCGHFTSNEQNYCADCGRKKDDPFKIGDVVKYWDGEEGRITHIKYDYDKIEKPKYKINGKYVNFDSITGLMENIP